MPDFKIGDEVRIKDVDHDVCMDLRVDIDGRSWSLCRGAIGRITAPQGYRVDFTDANGDEDYWWLPEHLLEKTDD